jgi:hypothetical protein
MRLAMLAAFKNDPNVHAILLSLKAGGEGLNLQHASRTAYSRGALAQCCNAPPCVATGVFLMDPWWNPAVEHQVPTLWAPCQAVRPCRSAHGVRPHASIARTDVLANAAAAWCCTACVAYCAWLRTLGLLPLGTSALEDGITVAMPIWTAAYMSPPHHTGAVLDRAAGLQRRCRVLRCVAARAQAHFSALLHQAIQRAHRIGQTREVHAVRFVTAGTIEERMMQLQVPTGSQAVQRLPTTQHVAT